LKTQLGIARDQSPELPENKYVLIDGQPRRTLKATLTARANCQNISRGFDFDLFMVLQLPSVTFVHHFYSNAGQLETRTRWPINFARRDPNEDNVNGTCKI
jgi:hypothetical protein